MHTATVMTESYRDAAEARVRSRVEAPLDYVAPGAGTPAIETTATGGRVERNFTAARHTVPIANGWLAPEPALNRHETAVQDFEDEAEMCGSALTRDPSRVWSKALMRLRDSRIRQGHDRRRS